MSQAAARLRDPIDLDEFERKLRGAAPEAKYGEDPLQELSRLIGAQPDPFDQLFSAESAQRAARPDPLHSQRQVPRQAQLPPPEPAVEPAFDASPTVEASAFSELLSQFPDAPARFAAAAPAEEQGQASYEPSYGYGAEERAFTQAGDVDPGLRPSYEAAFDKAPSRRPLYLMGGALVVLIAGIGAVLLNRAGHTNGVAPTIQASTAPVKVAPAVSPVSELTQQQQAVSVLDKSNTERLAASRVVNREEQPVDIQATARPRRAGDAASAPAGAASNIGLFPEPRRVKTVSVRPDGSVITGEMPSAPSPQRPVSATATPIPPTRAASAPAAAPQTPKATVRATPTDGAERPQTEAALAAPAAARPKPAETTASTAGGGYAVQLAAPGSEAEARSVMNTLAKRYRGELGGRRLNFRKATVGEKSVYRVRVNGLSQEAATGVCAKLQAKGGSCFVTRN